MRRLKNQFPQSWLNNSFVEWKHIYSEERMKRLILVVVLLTLTALMVACGGGAAVEEPAQEAAPTEAVVAETAPTEEAAPEVVPTEEPVMDEDMAEGSYLERAEAGEFTGKTVSLLGVMVDEEAQKMNLALAPFEEATGIDVVYEGSKEFETQINVAVDAGAPPDVANISQPAMVERFAAVGALTDISSFAKSCRKPTSTAGSTWPPCPAPMARTSWPASGSAPPPRAWSSTPRPSSTLPAT